MYRLLLARLGTFLIVFLLCSGCSKAVPPPEGPMGPLPTDRDELRQLQQQASDRVQRVVQGDNTVDEEEQRREKLREEARTVKPTRIDVQPEWSYDADHEFWVCTLKFDVETNVPQSVPLGKHMLGNFKAMRTKPDGSDLIVSSSSFKLIRHHGTDAEFEGADMTIRRCEPGELRLIMTVLYAGPTEVWSGTIQIPERPERAEM